VTAVEIRRQADTHNPSGVVRPAVPGPPPVRNQVREALLRVESLPDGRLRISTPQARGWAMVVRTRDELARAIGQAFTEVQVASYAAWRGEPYDLDALTVVDNSDPLTASAAAVDMSAGQGRTLRRTDIHQATAWSPIGDGKWRSPGGREYREDTQAVRAVLAKRRALGLGTGDTPG
jgi:hypothetical protein